MNNLERYIMLERVYVDLEEHNDFESSAQLENVVSQIFFKLTSEELNYLTNRSDAISKHGIKFLKSVESLDTIPLPHDMLWGALNQPRL